MRSLDFILNVTGHESWNPGVSDMLRLKCSLDTKGEMFRAIDYLSPELKGQVGAGDINCVTYQLVNL